MERIPFMFMIEIIFHTYYSFIESHLIQTANLNAILNAMLTITAFALVSITSTSNARKSLDILVFLHVGLFRIHGQEKIK